MLRMLRIAEDWGSGRGGVMCKSGLRRPQRDLEGFRGQNRSVGHGLPQKGRGTEVLRFDTHSFDIFL
jgi:hypothetical protein